MDKKLRELKKEFENEIPVSFTDRDRQNVIEKIHKKKNDHMLHFFPWTLTAIILGVFILIGGIIVNNDFHNINFEGSITNTSNESELDISMNEALNKTRKLLNQLTEVETTAASYDGKMEIKFRLMVEKQLTETEATTLFNQILDSIVDHSNNKNIWDYYNGHFDIMNYDAGVIYTATKLIGEDLVVNELLDNNTYNITFDLETVQVGDILGDFEITDIQNHKGETLITFQGNTILSGDIDYFEKLEFIPDKWSLNEFPIANQHLEEEINFYFHNSHSINKEGATPEIPQNIGVDVTGFQYFYSPILGSSINLEIREYIGVKFEGEDLTETHETTIELSDELLEIYNQYEFSLDDLLLKDLGPIDIFKLYHHANQVDNQDVVYTLFNQDGTYDIPDKETYFDDIAYAEDEVMKKNDNKYYQELKTVNQFHEVYTGDHEAVITYSTNSSDYDQIFQLIKDNRTNVWKVSWMPIQ